MKKHTTGTTGATETKKLLKAVILGPIITAIAVTLVYTICWLLSEVFMEIHSFVTDFVIPWLAESWWILIGAWICIVVASTIYYVIFYTSNKSQQSEKKEMNVDNGNVAGFNDEVQMFHR